MLEAEQDNVDMNVVIVNFRHAKDRTRFGWAMHGQTKSDFVINKNDLCNPGAPQLCQGKEA
jgi:hypothetical protein